MKHFNIFFILLLLSINGYASTYEWTAYLSKSDIDLGTTILKVNDLNFPSGFPGSDPTQVRIAKASVRLIYTRDQQSDVNNPGVNKWSYDVTYKISGTSSPSSPFDLGIAHDIGDEYRYQQVRIHDLAGTTVDLTQISATSVGNVPDDIVLELRLEVETYCEINSNLIPSDVYTQTINNDKQLQIAWDYIDCAESYELEWVYLDSCSYIDNESLFNLSLLLYGGNFVRISTSNQFYNIDLHYPAGQLFIRVRGVGVFTQNVNGDYCHQKYSQWSTHVPFIIPEKFEPNKMWQVVSTYAEDGKYKKVNTFVDGSGRTRQVLTNLSTDSTIIIGESKYDDEGRGNLSFMPVPEEDICLDYRPFFNRPNGADEYLKSDFRDYGVTPTSSDNNFGASNYYSPNNTSNSIHRDYIPDAERYPFSLTQFDGLGRPKLQGGVGRVHQIGFEDHETKYYYAGANSTELRRLFGSNVGPAEHYSKDIVMDANGQISVAYKDLADRTIATALAGDSPDNVIPLDYANSTSISVNLNENNVINLDDQCSSTQHTQMNIINNTDYDFTYDFTGEINKIGFPYDVCPTCEYILKIDIATPDDCRTPSASDINLTITSGTLPDYSDNYSIIDTIKASSYNDCTNAYPAYLLTFETTFESIGEYTISKSLCVSEASWDNFLQSLEDSDALPDSTAIIDRYLSQIDTTQCEWVIENDSIVQGIVDTIAFIDCHNLLELMKIDIRPNGDYHHLVPTDSVVTLDNDSLYVVLYHPEYCRYENCVATTPSRQYNSKMSFIDNWTEASNSVSLPNQYNIDFTQPLFSDPLFNSFLPNPPIWPPSPCNYRRMMEDYVYRHVFSFQEAHMPPMPPPPLQSFTGIEAFADFLANRFSVDLGVPADELKWRFFRGYYQAKKQELLEAFYADVTCNPSPCPIEDNPCVHTINLNVPTTPGGTYQAEHLVSSDVSITQGSNTNFIAGDHILLEPGFVATPATTFLAYIGDCYGTTPGSMSQISDEDDLQDWLTQQSLSAGLDDCDGYCDAAVEVWMDQFTFECDSLAHPLSYSDSLDLANYLKVYCQSKCTPSNPFVAMKRDEWLTDANLINAQTILNDLCSDTLYYMVSTVEECFYDTLNYVNETITAENTDICLLDFIDNLNNLVFTDCSIATNNLGNYNWANLDIEPNCPQWTDPIEIQSNNINLPNSSCIYLSFYKVDGSLMFLSDISEMGTPEFDFLPSALFPTMGSENYLNLRTLIRDKNCDEYYVYIYSACLSPIMYSTTSETVSRIDTICVCEPPSFEIDFNQLEADCIDLLKREARYHALQHWQDTVNQVINGLREYYRCLPDFENDCKGLYFDGANDRVEAPTSVMNQINTGDFTFEAWFEADEANTSAFPLIFSNRASTGGGFDGVCFGFHNNFGGSTNKLLFLQLNGINLLSLNTPQLLDAKCHHIAISREGNTLYYYADGLLIDTKTRPIVDISSSEPLLIGADAVSPSSHPWGELIKEIRIWDVARTNIEIQNNLSQTLNGNEVGLLAHYEMNEGTGQIIKDKTYNNFDGLLGTTSGSDPNDPVWHESCCENGFAESFLMDYELKEYHYTLYYYDQSGNLVKTIPPEAVYPTTINQLTHFGGPYGQDYIGPEPEHNYDLASCYKFNSWNQSIQQTSPDAGLTTMYYDDKGQIRLSQNARQAAENPVPHYSYSKYDNQGRMIEVGQAEGILTFDDQQLNDANFPTAGQNLSEIVQTTYDTDGTTFVSDRNLRGRVAQIKRLENIITPISTIDYDYDPHGNVKMMHQKSQWLDEKEIEYEYDQVSGNVNKFIYQNGKADQYWHQFEYDADNRLTEVWTSRDNVIWQRDARYFYYAHGPLARVELGHDIVQGLDYYYSIHGWIKGMNIPEIDGINDPSKDAYDTASNLNRWAGRDTVSYALGYYQADFKPIGIVDLAAAKSKRNFDDLGQNNFILGSGRKGLFNGNIPYMITDIPENGSGTLMQAMTYHYDQLHRIKAANSFQDYNTSGWGGRTPGSNNRYDATYAYDKNGNLEQLTRRGSTSQLIDDFIYNYPESSPGRKKSNQLDYVKDSKGDAGENDLDNQAVTNYDYDEIGNLTKDEQSKIAEIIWQVDGKVKEILFDAGENFSDGKPKIAIAFKYDGMGNRIQKIHKKGTNPEDWVIYHYQRDAQGNILAVYEQTFEKIPGTGQTIALDVDLEVEMDCRTWETATDIYVRQDYSVINKGPGSTFTATVVSRPPTSGTILNSSNVTLNSVNNPNTNVSYIPIPASDLLEWTITDIPAGGAVTFSVEYYFPKSLSVNTVTQAGYVNTSSANDPDSNPGFPVGNEDDEAECTISF